MVLSFRELTAAGDARFPEGFAGRNYPFSDYHLTP